MRALGLTGATSVVVLLANAVGGVLVARLLSASGKGAVTSIANWAQLTAWLCAVGFGAAATYYQSRNSEDGPRLVGTCFLATAVFGSFGFVAAEVLVTIVFADQSDSVLRFAQLFMFSIFLQVLMDALMGVIQGEQDFGFYNLTRVLQPCLYVGLLVALSAVVGLDVGWALLAAASAHALTLALTLRRAVRTIGIGRPSMGILRWNFSYGLKLQGGQLAGLASYRLDILVMPAVLSTTAVGLYSVAVSVASMVLSLMGSMSNVVFPVATRAGSNAAPALITRALRFTVFLALVVSAGLFVVAPWLVRFVYGEEFADGVLALRILLPGYVFAAGASIIVAGLKALNRPWAASVGQLTSLPVTAVGLLVVLDAYGIEGAAVVSTVAFGVQMVVGGWALMRAGGISMRGLLSVRGLLADGREVRAKLSRRSSR